MSDDQLWDRPSGRPLLRTVLAGLVPTGWLVVAALLVFTAPFDHRVWGPWHSSR